MRTETPLTRTKVEEEEEEQEEEQLDGREPALPGFDRTSRTDTTRVHQVNSLVRYSSKLPDPPEDDDSPHSPDLASHASTLETKTGGSSPPSNIHGGSQSPSSSSLEDQMERLVANSQSRACRNSSNDSIGLRHRCPASDPQTPKDTTKLPPLPTVTVSTASSLHGLDWVRLLLLATMIAFLTGTALALCLGG